MELGVGDSTVGDRTAVAGTEVAGVGFDGWRLSGYLFLSLDVVSEPIHVVSTWTRFSFPIAR